MQDDIQKFLQEKREKFKRSQEYPITDSLSYACAWSREWKAWEHEKTFESLMGARGYTLKGWYPHPGFIAMERNGRFQYGSLWTNGTSEVELVIRECYYGRGFQIAHIELAGILNRMTYYYRLRKTQHFKSLHKALDKLFVSKVKLTVQQRRDADRYFAYLLDPTEYNTWRWEAFHVMRSGKSTEEALELAADKLVRRCLHMDYHKTVDDVVHLLGNAPLREARHLLIDTCADYDVRMCPKLHEAVTKHLRGPLKRPAFLALVHEHHRRGDLMSYLASLDPQDVDVTALRVLVDRNHIPFAAVAPYL